MRIYGCFRMRRVLMVQGDVPFTQVDYELKQNRKKIIE